MKRSGITLAALTAAAALLLSSNPATQPAGADLSGDQADSVEFVLNFGHPEQPTIGHVVYCGVDRAAEPFVFDAAVSNPPRPVDPNDPEAGLEPGHEGAGWLEVMLQGDRSPDGRGVDYNVPSNDSFSLGLTLGGRPRRDQIVRLTSIPAGDPWGSGSGFQGHASVRAQSGATDPFDGDRRSDNFCVSIDVPGGRRGEFSEGTISTRLPVPDSWVVDGNGADGGILSGFPH